jgi:hypothetical protein
MKRAGIFLRISVAIFCLGMTGAVNPAANAGQFGRGRDRDCKRRCDEEFRRRKAECRGLRGRDRHRCEERAKDAHNWCKRRCHR